MFSVLVDETPREAELGQRLRLPPVADLNHMG
jgi:hypothetical protein